MGVELEALLRFQAALGGDAVVLSATLPAVRRAQLVQAWLDGVRDGGWDAGQGVRDGPSLQPGAYPLVTTVSPEGVREWPLAAAPWSRRSVPVRFVHTPDWMQRTARARTSARGSS